MTMISNADTDTDPDCDPGIEDSSRVRTLFHLSFPPLPLHPFPLLQLV